MLRDLRREIDQKQARVWLEKQIKLGSIIEQKTKRKAKTIKQNAYLHVCITLFAIEFGYTLQEAKTHLKRNCNYDFVKYKKNDEWFLKSIADYDNEETAKMIDYVREYSAKQGCYIPTSQEYLEKKWEIEIEIERNKKHL